MRNRLIALATLVAMSAPQLGGQTSKRINFVSCPIVQDTATVPCWLSEYEGQEYYLGIQTDISADFDHLASAVITVRGDMMPAMGFTRGRICRQGWTAQRIM